MFDKEAGTQNRKKLGCGQEGILANKTRKDVGVVE